MKRVARAAAATLAAVVVLLTVYGFAIEPRLILEERRETAEIPHLPEAWHGAEVAVFSDLQVGMWWDNAAMIERVVDRVVETQPALVLLAGDFLYGRSPAVPDQVDTVVRILHPLVEAGLPTYAVLGNHDYASGGAQEITRALEDLGIPVLQNEHVAVAAPDAGGRPIQLVGLGPTAPGLTDVGTALSGLPDDAPRLVLLHNPTAFPRLPAGSAPLAVAGHTHCGQIALPGSPEWSYLALTEREQVVADGWAPPDYGEAGNALFVTCGIGFSLVPARINAPPQLVRFTLEEPQ